MALKFNYEKLMNDYIEYFFQELDWALNAWEAEVYSHTRSKFALKSIGKKRGLGVGTVSNPEVKQYIKKSRRRLFAYLEANTSALVDAYGTGSLMNITDNPGFKEYFNDKNVWNPLRHGKEIVGRKKGDYIDLFGRPRHTKGTYAGKPMEGMKFNGFEIKPIPPSNSIKIANKLLFNTYLPAALKNAIDRIKISNYVIEVNSK